MAEVMVSMANPNNTMPGASDVGAKKSSTPSSAFITTSIATGSATFRPSDSQSRHITLKFRSANARNLMGCISFPQLFSCEVDEHVVEGDPASIRGMDLDAERSEHVDDVVEIDVWIVDHHGTVTTASRTKTDFRHTRCRRARLSSTHGSRAESSPKRQGRR